MARVPVSLWGFGGWGCVRSTLRLRPQPFAKQLASSAKAVTFEGFKRRVTSFRVAGVALCDIPADLFHHVSRGRSVWQAQYFCVVFRRWLPFSGQAQHFRRAVSRVFANRIVKAASSGANVHTAWQVWDIVRVSFCVAGGAAFEEDPALHTLRFTLYTLTVHVSQWFICVSFFVEISSQHGMSTTSAATSMMAFSLSVSTTVPLTWVWAFWFMGSLGGQLSWLTPGLFLLSWDRSGSGSLWRWQPQAWSWREIWKSCGRSAGRQMMLRGPFSWALHENPSVVGRQRRCGNWKVYSAIRLRPYLNLIIPKIKISQEERWNLSLPEEVRWPFWRRSTEDCLSRRKKLSRHTESATNGWFDRTWNSEQVDDESHTLAFFVTVAPVVFAAPKTMEVNWDSIFSLTEGSANFPGG